MEQLKTGAHRGLLRFCMVPPREGPALALARTMVGRVWGEGGMEGRDGPETCVRAPGLFELLGMERATPGGFIDLVLPWQWSRVHATLSTSVDPCSTPFTLLFGPQSPNDPKPCPPWVVGSANRGCKRGLHTPPPPTGRKKGACQWSLFGGMGGGEIRERGSMPPPPPVPIQCWETHAQPTSSQKYTVHSTKSTTRNTIWNGVSPSEADPRSV